MTYAFHVDPRNPACDKTELQIQVGFRNKMHMAAPSVMLVAIPNEGKRSQWEACKRKREGLVAGFPDMLALWDGKTAGLEFKTGKGTLSETQVETLNGLARRGFPVGVFRSPDTALAWLREQGAPVL